MRRILVALLLACVAAPPAVASADDGWRFRLTTPRGEIVDDGDELLVAIPGGRAWGITTGLLRLPEPGTLVSALIDVRDARVREAFLRVAYYERASGRPRQVLVQDSAPVRAGEQARVVLRLDPPEGAVAYRARVLGRLLAEVEASSSGAIGVREVQVGSGSRAPEVRRTRLMLADR